MKDFFYAIQDLFVNVLFAPLDALRSLELENWWAANAASWMFIVIGMAFFGYWMKQLNIFNKTEAEDKSISAHSYL
jgi:hypothetical protein